MDKRICKLCGKEYQPTNPNQKYCTDDHYKPCPVCGKPVKWIGFDRCCSKKCSLELRKQTCMEKFGGPAPICNSEVVEKMKQTTKKKYGVEWASQLPSVKQKQVDTYYKNYGKEQNPEGYQDLLKRTHETCIEKYGEDKNWSSASHRQKLIEANRKRFGTDNVSYSMHFKEHAAYKSAKHFHDILSSESSKEKLNNLVNNWKSESRSIEFSANLILDILADYDIHGIKSYRLGEFDYDIVIPDLRIAVSLDTTLKHNSYINIYDVKERGLDKTYHLKLTENAESCGYRCIHIFDWDDISKILMLLFNHKSVRAKHCQVLPITQYEADMFLDLCSLYGKYRYDSTNQVRLGLFLNGDLLQVAIFRKSKSRKYDYEWTLMCSDPAYRVLGGASKLLKHFVSHNECNSIITYCDRSKFSGDVYTKIGFECIKSEGPSLIWSKGREHYRDYDLSSSGFYDKVLGKDYDETKSKHELLIENGWLPIYDCGRYVFEWRKGNR